MQPPPAPPYPGPIPPSPAAEEARHWVEISRLLVLVLSLVALAFGVLAFIAVHALGILSGAFLILGFVIGMITYLKLGDILRMLAPGGDLRTASGELLLWGILALIFVLVIPGVLLLIAWIRLEDSLRAPPSPYAPPPPFYGATPGAPSSAPPSPGSGAPAPGTPPPPPPLPSVPATPLCPRCGTPSAYLPQYGRYYCYRCQRYL